MVFLARLIAWLNVIGNRLFGWLEKPMTALPAWLSLTVISAVLGVILLILFKYTSDQAAISHVRDKIKAHLLAMKLFRDNIPVVLKSQARILVNAFLLLFHSFRPMLVMIVPFTVILAQLGLWYQFRPLSVGQQAVVTVQLAGCDTDPMPPVSLDPADAARITTGPIRVPSKRQVFWRIQPTRSGVHQLQFDIADTQVQKQLVVGDGFMPVSVIRPAPDNLDLILNPAEKPFDASSLVRSITIDYPARSGWFCGTDIWVISLFVISMAVAFLLKPFFKVKF